MQLLLHKHNFQGNPERARKKLLVYTVLTSLPRSGLYCLNLTVGTFPGVSNVFCKFYSECEPKSEFESGDIEVRERQRFFVIIAAQRAATYSEGRARKVDVRELEYRMKAEFQDSGYNVT